MYEEYPLFTCLLYDDIYCIVKKHTCSTVFVEVCIPHHKYIFDAQGVNIQEILTATGNLIDEHQ